MKCFLTFALFISTLSTYSINYNLILFNTDTTLILSIKKRNNDTVNWVSQDDKIIMGAEISRLNVNVDFDNVYYYLNDSSIYTAKTWDYWKFRTSHNPIGISYFINSRFGKLNFFSHKITTNTSAQPFNSTFVNFGYAFQFKRIILGASYRNIQSFKRDNQYFVWQDTLLEMSNTNMRFSIEFIARETSMFNKYGFSQLYIPVKSTYYINVKSESAFTRFADKNEIIQYYAIVSNSQGNIGKFNSGNNMQKFTLYMQSFLMHFGGIIPFFKKTGQRAKSLAFGFDGHVGLDMFYYSIYTRDHLIAKSGFKIGIAKNTYAIASLRYSDKWFLAGVSLSWRLIYITPSISTANKLTHVYFLNTLTGYMAFRIPFSKSYAKINAAKSKVFKKSKA
jgi:hypothetical protein